jgi:spermidine synthase
MIPILVTAFLEGLSVLVLEIAGARALAPFFGTSLSVWTAMITATLLFLATGYGVGGRLSERKPEVVHLTFWGAGGWLLLFPFWRSAVLGAFGGLGVSLGAFVSSAYLFGPPLVCLGAVSPLLVHRLGTLGVEAGRGAGTLFFVNTLGGLVGGWLTALVFIPLLPLRQSLAGIGALLMLIGGYWARKQGSDAHLALTALASVLFISMAPSPRNVFALGDSSEPNARVIARKQSTTGLVQVIETQGPSRALYVNGVDQGGIDLVSGASLHPFSDYLALMLYRYHPNPRRVLLLGLGCGVLAKNLSEMGMHVTAVELDPVVADFAQRYFALPRRVEVILEDARTFLGKARGSYDVVVLDVFAGESSPWYLLTREALEAVRARLAPGGRLVLNSVTQANGESEGLKRLEASLLAVFGEARVFIEPRLPSEGETLVNATLVAGKGLVENEKRYPGRVSRQMAPYVGDFNGTPKRPARKGATIDTDDFSSLDLAEAKARMHWREDVLRSFGPDVLQD